MRSNSGRWPGWRVHKGGGKEVHLPPEFFLSICREGRVDELLRGCEGNPVLIDGTLKIGRGEKFREIPAVHIIGDLIVDPESGIEFCGAEVVGNASFAGGRIKNFGNRFSCHDLDINGCQNLDRLDFGVSGMIMAKGSSITETGDRFACRGDFHAENCLRLVRVCGSVGGGCILSGSGVRETGTGFTCGGNFYAAGCSDFRELRLGGSPRIVSLTKSGVTRIAKGLRCTDILDVSFCRSLGVLEDARTGGLDISHSGLRLVRRVEVQGDFSASHCPEKLDIQSLKAHNACFNDCSLKGLDAEVRVDGSIFLENCSCIRLEGSYGKDVQIHQSVVEKAGPRFKCGGRVTVATGSSVESISGQISGDLIVRPKSRVRILGADCNIGMGLRLEWGGEEDIREETVCDFLDCNVGTVSTDGAGFAESGENFLCRGDLLAANCRGLRQLKGVVQGDADLRGSDIECLGADFECHGSLRADGCSMLNLVNCQIGGSFSAKNTPSVRRGPNFSQKTPRGGHPLGKGNVRGGRDGGATGGKTPAGRRSRGGI